MRFFFDYVREDRSLFDYRGEEFHSSDSAINFAEAIVQDLKQSLSADWNGWSLEVRNVAGKKLLTLPIGDSELQAA